MSISSSLILKAFIDRLKANATVITETGSRVYANVPQDSPLPYVRCVITSCNDENEDKDFTTLTYTVQIDIWTNNHTQKKALDIGDAIREDLDGSTLSGTSGQSLLLTFNSYDMTVEADGQTHHQTMEFTYIEVDNG